MQRDSGGRRLLDLHSIHSQSSYLHISHTNMTFTSAGATVLIEQCFLTQILQLEQKQNSSSSPCIYSGVVSRKTIDWGGRERVRNYFNSTSHEIILKMLFFSAMIPIPILIIREYLICLG